MHNILITTAGRRVSLVNAFKVELQKVYPAARVFVSDYSPNLSAAAQVADKSFITPLSHESNYIDSLLTICLDNQVSLLIPTIDTELAILSKNKHLFESNGVMVVVSNEEFIHICEDKIRTQQLFQTLNLDVIKCYDKNSYILPIYIKPVDGSSSINNYIVKSENQISKYHLKNDALQFFEYLDHDIYDEYSCDLYYDKHDCLKCVIPRVRIEIRAGEVSKSITMNGAVKEFIDKNFSHLKGARGCITLQLFHNEEENVFKGIEINARFGGGFPLSYLAGGNYPLWTIEEYLLNKEISYYDGWEANLLMLRYDKEILLRNYDK